MSSPTLVDWHAFYALDRQGVWSVDWFRLSESARPVEVFTPGCVVAVPLVPHACSHIFWEPPNERRRPGRKRDADASGSDGDNADGMDLDEADPDENVAPGDNANNSGSEDSLDENSQARLILVVVVALVVPKQRRLEQETNTASKT